MKVQLLPLVAACLLTYATDKAVAQVSFSCDVQPPSGSARLDTYVHAVGFVAARDRQQSPWVVQGTATLVGVGSENGGQVGFYLTAAHVVEFAQKYQHHTLLLPFGDGDGAAFTEEASGKPGNKLDGTADDWAIISVELPDDITLTPMFLRATGQATPSAMVMTAHILSEEQETEDGSSDAVDREALANWQAGKSNLKITRLDPAGTPPTSKYLGSVFPQMSGGLMIDGAGYGFGLVAMTDLDWGDGRLLEEWYRQQTLDREQVWYASIRIEDEWVEKLPVGEEIHKIVKSLSDSRWRSSALAALWARVYGHAPMSFADYGFFLRQCPNISEEGWEIDQQEQLSKITVYLEQRFCPDKSELARNCQKSVFGLADLEFQMAVQRANVVLGKLSLVSATESKLSTTVDLRGAELLDPFREACQSSAAPESCLLSASTAIARAEYGYAEYLLQTALFKGLTDEAVYVAAPEQSSGGIFNFSGMERGMDVFGRSGDDMREGLLEENQKLAGVAANVASIQNALAAAGDTGAAARALQSIDQAYSYGLSGELAAELERDAHAAWQYGVTQYGLMLGEHGGPEPPVMAWQPEAQAISPGMAVPQWRFDDVSGWRSVYLQPGWQSGLRFKLVDPDAPEPPAMAWQPEAQAISPGMAVPQWRFDLEFPG